MLLREVLVDLGEDDPIVPMAWETGSLLWAKPTVSWAETAVWLSRTVGGLVIPGDHGCTWVLGQLVQWLVDPAMRDATLEARACCLGLGLEPGWSVGACARRIVRWLEIRQYPERGMEVAWRDNLIGYRDCSPGLYENVVQWDLSGCYFQLLSRLPSPLVSWTKDGPLWANPGPVAMGRWRAALEAVASCKPIRNALWGVLLGSSAGRRAYHQGKVVKLPRRPGWLRPAAVLVGRTAYELCWSASGEVGSVYSATDSVIGRSGSPPVEWAAYGLPCRRLGEGEAEICAPGIYRIGHSTTAYYTRGSRFIDPFPRPEEIGPQVRGWLGWAA